MPKIDVWAEMDQQVLNALDPIQPRTAGELRLSLPDSHVRATLESLARSGRVTRHRNNVRTTYTKVA